MIIHKIFLNKLDIYKLVKENVDENFKNSHMSENFQYVHKWKKKNIVYTPEDLLLPDVIYVKGSYSNKIGKKKCIAICGTLSPSYQGFELAEKISFMISQRGIPIISGGVPGIDTAAHLGSLGYSNGFTISVLPNPVECGLNNDSSYSTFLNSSIIERGCLVSEYCDSGSVSNKLYNERLLDRDRIISGLSDSIIIIECSADSATVDTAKRAYLQGKKVYSVVWDKKVKYRHKAKTSGNNQLLDIGIASPLYSNNLNFLENI